MSIVGKSISIEQAATVLEAGTVTKELTAGSLSAKWVQVNGRETVVVQGLGEEFLELEAA